MRKRVKGSGFSKLLECQTDRMLTMLYSRERKRNKNDEQALRYWHNGRMQLVQGCSLDRCLCTSEVWIMHHSCTPFSEENVMGAFPCETRHHDAIGGSGGCQGIF